jgi:putative thioredoxin
MSAGDNPFAPASGTPQAGVQTVAFGGGVAAATPAGDLIKDTTTAGFPTDVIAESHNQPILIDFWAPWCGPCKQLTPRLEAAVKKAGGKVKLVKMNIDDHPAIPGQMGVQSIPAVIAFDKGKPVDGFMGAVPDSEIDTLIAKLAGGAGGGEEEAIVQALEAAQAALDAGDKSGAAQIYSMVLERFPDNAPAFGGLAGVMLDSGQSDQAKAMLDNAPAEIADTPEIASLRARIELAEKVAGLGDPIQLEARLFENPTDHEARFDLAQIKAATGDRETAADLLLDIIKVDREWREDGARLELLKFFEAWGPADAASIKGRRKLSSLLFR